MSSGDHHDFPLIGPLSHHLNSDSISFGLSDGQSLLIWLLFIAFRIKNECLYFSMMRSIIFKYLRQFFDLCLGKFFYHNTIITLFLIFIKYEILEIETNDEFFRKLG